MKRISILLPLFILFIPFSSAQNINLDALRREYAKANSDSSLCARLYQKITKDNSTDNTIICYKGAVTATMANHTKSKQEKLKLFNTGKKLMEESISKDSNNVELHFIRLTIQTNCPKILGYNKQIERDKNIILSNFSAVNNQVLRSKMSEFLLHSSALSESEKQKIK